MQLVLFFSTVLMQFILYFLYCFQVDCSSSIIILSINKFDFDMAGETRFL
ncbi:hypothetical protein Hanom_Chr16g01500121 [Helianthus anomalus]